MHCGNILNMAHLSRNHMCFSCESNHCLIMGNPGKGAIVSCQSCGQYFRYDKPGLTPLEWQLIATPKKIELTHDHYCI